MKKSFFLLLIASTILCIKTTSASSLKNGCKADTLQPDISDAQAFNLCYNSLVFWWMDSQQKDTIIYQMNKIILSYKEVIGIEASSKEDLKRLYDLQKSLENESMQFAYDKEKRRKGRWRKTAAITTLVAIVEGAAIYFLVR